MKLIYSKDFKLKLSTNGYPLYGLSMVLLNLDNQSELSKYEEWFTEGYGFRTKFDEVLRSAYGNGKYQFVTHSSRRNLPTLIEDNKCSISVQLDPTESANNISLIVLYYFDLVKYTIGDTVFIGEDAFCKDINNVAAVILVEKEDSDLLKNTTNIITLSGIDYWDTMRTSMVEPSKFDYVNHYRSALLDRKFIGDIDDSDFIDSVSGDEYCRSIRYTQLSNELNSHMCIDSNSVIRL